jgi:hypothetical protein
MTNSNSQASQKKPYYKPCLRLYGSIEAITQSVANKGNADTTPGKKTH